MTDYYSYSRLMTFRKCPKAFEFSYIKEIPEAFQTIEKHLGTAVHEAFDWTYRETKNGFLPTQENVLEKYLSSWTSLDIAGARIVKKGMTAADYFRQGSTLIKSHYQRVIRNDPDTTLHLEHEFEIRLAEGISYRGIIDRVSQLPSGRLRLTDYKTGRTVPDPASDLQLRSYTLNFFQQPGHDAVDICYEDLRGCRSLSKSVLRMESDSILSEVRQLIDEVRSCMAFPAKSSMLCTWCGYNAICDEGCQLKNEKDRSLAPAQCPRCSSPLRPKNGRFGPFLSCTNFPACRYSCNP